MIKLFFKSLLLLFVFSVALSGCKEEKPEGLFTQGKLEYKIYYLNADQGNFDPSLLPKKMTLEFNEKYSTNTIDGFMGMFKLQNITYFEKHKSITYLKVLDKNYLFKGAKKELMCCFDVFEDLEIVEDTTTKVICGLKSRHAKIKIPKTGDVFDIYYTFDISLENPNLTNPYLDLDGVLTDFVLYMAPYKMRFVAQKFTPNKNSKNAFNAPDNAVELSRDEMIYALERLMQ